MRNTVVAFIAGCALTSAVFLLLDRGPEVPAPIERSTIHLPERADDDSTDRENSSPTPEADASPVDEASAVATLASPPAGNESTTSEESQPVPFGWNELQQAALLQFLGFRATQSRESMLSGPLDPNWTAPAENVFLDYLARQPGLVRYGFPEVDCRASICEVKLTAFGANERTAEYWMSSIREGISDYRWADAWFITGFTTEEQNGGTAVSWYFTDRGPFMGESLQFSIDVSGAAPTQ